MYAILRAPWFRQYLTRAEVPSVVSKVTSGTSGNASVFPEIVTRGLPDNPSNLRATASESSSPVREELQIIEPSRLSVFTRSKIVFCFSPSLPPGKIMSESLPSEENFLATDGQRFSEEPV